MSDAAVTDPPPHPATYSAEALEAISLNLGPCRYILDPFAGVGGIHELRPYYATVGVELEEEWARQSPYTIVGDALDLPFADASFDAIATSPAYGNRMADHHNARDDTRRITYKHYLGRDLSDGSSGMLQWGDEYREFHRQAWIEAARVVRPGGRLLVVVADHVRGGKRQMVTMWHEWCITRWTPFRFVEEVLIPKAGMRFGANRDVRVEHESVLVFVREMGAEESPHVGTADSWEVE